jgi:O-antigen/teichoic acid export membrane protein
MSDLKQKTITGSFWSLFERFGYLGIQFVSNLVLARLLMPSDFGTVGVLIIFTTLSAVLIDSGLTAALIQKKEISNADTSTVFYTNLALAIFVYIIIFFSAPLVSVYFNNPDLTVLLRVIELMVIIDAFPANVNFRITA